jgi:hypothetical protein
MASSKSELRPPASASPEMATPPLSTASTLDPYPFLVVSGVTTPLNDCQSLLTQKGFILKYSLTEKSKSLLVVEVSPKLHLKLAIKYDYPVHTRQFSTDGDITRIVHLSQQILLKSGINYESSWLMNQSEKVPPLPPILRSSSPFPSTDSSWLLE